MISYDILGAMKKGCISTRTFVSLSLLFFLFCCFINRNRAQNEEDTFTCQVHSSTTLEQQKAKDPFNVVGTETSLKSLRIIQYNVEWLFLEPSPNESCPGSGCSWANEDEAETHATQVAQILRSLKGDIVNLCEIEGCDELLYLQNLLPDLNYNHYMIQGSDTITYQNVGLLSNIKPTNNLMRSNLKVSYPVSGTTCNDTPYSNFLTEAKSMKHKKRKQHQNKGTWRKQQVEYKESHKFSSKNRDPGEKEYSGVSKHYHTTFQINEMNIALIGIHLLAIPTDPSRCMKREAQATVIRSIVDEYSKKGYEILVMGDFNDFDGEVLDRNSNKPTSRVLSIIKGDNLYTAAEKINQSQRYSDWYDADLDCQEDLDDDVSMIDHILMTKGLFEKIENVSIRNDLYREFCGTYNSDHWPVVVDFTF